MSTQTNPRRLFTIREAAARLGVGEWRAYQLARIGVLPVVRLGRSIRVDPEQLDAFIARGGDAYSADEVAGVRAQSGFRRR